jgi:hypothetical protein
MPDLGHDQLEQDLIAEVGRRGVAELMEFRAFRPGRRHGSPLPGTYRPQTAGSNILANSVLGTASTGFVEDLFRPIVRGRGRCSLS